MTIDPGKKKKPGKGHYHQTQLQNMKTGEKGEALVMFALKNKWGKIDPKLKLSHVSKIDDSLGYDIHAVFNGEDHLIEVKATKGTFNTSRIFISENEVEVAKKEGENYYIYFVSEIDSRSPKITVVKNPFDKPHPDFNVCLQPVSHRLSLKKHHKVVN